MSPSLSVEPLDAVHQEAAGGLLRETRFTVALVPLAPFGRPRGLPERPGLKRVATGGRP
jgi:hypothetical protein